MSLPDPTPCITDLDNSQTETQLEKAIIDASAHSIKPRARWAKQRMTTMEVLLSQSHHYVLQTSRWRNPSINVVAWLALAAVMPASADDSSAADQPDSGSGALAVTVVDREGMPVVGAWVAALDGSLKKMTEATTGADGKDALQLAPDAKVEGVFAIKRETGLDYVAYRHEGEPKSNPYKLAAHDRKPITLVLNGTHKVIVKVVDDHDQPLPGQPVYPWYFSKPKKGDDLLRRKRVLAVGC